MFRQVLHMDCTTLPHPGPEATGLHFPQTLSVTIISRHEKHGGLVCARGPLFATRRRHMKANFSQQTIYFSTGRLASLKYHM